MGMTYLVECRRLALLTIDRMGKAYRRWEGRPLLMISNENWTTRDLAEFMRTPESTVRYWRSSGQGPRYFRVGKRVLYRREDVLDWMAERLERSS